jgi:hypothetical protein
MAFQLKADEKSKREQIMCESEAQPRHWANKITPIATFVAITLNRRNTQPKEQQTPHLDNGFHPGTWWVQA